MIAYRYDNTGLFFQTLQIVKAEDCPSDALLIAPDAGDRTGLPGMFFVNTAKTGWDFVEDYRYVTVFDTSGNIVKITSTGPLPSGYTFTFETEDQLNKQREQDKRDAEMESSNIISARMQNDLLQTASFSAAEVTVFIKAGKYDMWIPGISLKAGTRIAYEAIVYNVIQDVAITLEHQYPGAPGMLAIYRPAASDNADGSIDNPYPFIYGMDVEKDKYYTYDGHKYKAELSMPACVYPPGTPGLWQWTLIE